jgi:uroporphyrinogen III methyltransferase/synthase
MAQKQRGMVYLVGAGPGDPGLLTIKGRDCLSRAQVVVYDYLANPELLEYAPKGTEWIYVGKRGGSHTMCQEEIGSLIVEKARQGKVVVRLKGGDPFIFGRGGEEAEDLSREGIPFEVVPGVTSAVAVPAYAGIPLTHREFASTVAFVTGHEDPKKQTTDIAWGKLSTASGTLVFLMGVGNLDKIVQRLIKNGRPPETPVAVIRRGTLAAQDTVVGTLETIGVLAKEKGITPPAIIVVGEVVRLREVLNWFETKPLFGRRIIVTRAREQASEFMQRLAELGADCIQFPTIQVMPPESWEPLDQSIGRLHEYHWVIFTSVNGVKFFQERLQAQGKDVRDLKGIQIGAIGPKTARMWEMMGIQPDLVPEEYRAEAVIAGLRKEGITGCKILVPRAEKAREILPEELREAGATVDVVPAYRTVKPEQRTQEIGEMLEKGLVDMVTFTSSSTVANFAEMFGPARHGLKAWMEKVVVACIGPITAKTAEEHGFAVHVVPGEYTIEALTQRIAAYFRSSSER